jgi:hypothetical protein
MWNRVSLILLLVLFIFLFLFTMKYWVTSNIPQAHLASISPLTFDIAGASRSKPTLRVYYPSHSERKTQSLGKILVKKLKKLNIYSSITITYYLGIAELDRIIRVHDKESKFDLLLMKPEILVLSTVRYIPLAAYGSYEVYLIAKDKKPVLSNRYLSGKSLGLLAKPTSQSGYIVPKSIIMQKINKNNLPKFINKYPSHFSLRKALESDEVNMISSYWSEKDRKEHPKWKFLKISHTLGSTWFLNIEKSQYQEDIFCAVVDSLEKMASYQKTKYWKNITIIYKCNQ